MSVPDIRFHQVRAHVRGADPMEMTILFDGHDANRHREIFEQAALDSQYDTVALFEHVTPRMVVHPPPAPAGAGGTKVVSEVKTPPIAAEVKAPEPETSHKGKSRKW